jgi:hypothetical protein
MIEYETLPRTLQNAVYVARRLGLQYVWIDALCIVQDDQEFKREQIRQMHQLFDNSYLTIQAGWPCELSNLDI